MKIHKGSYRGVKFDRPENISMRCIKRIIDSNVGSFENLVQVVIDIVSKELENQLNSLKNEKNYNNQLGINTDFSKYFLPGENRQ